MVDDDGVTDGDGNGDDDDSTREAKKRWVQTKKF
jgi:hypothetical protein